MNQLCKYAALVAQDGKPAKLPFVAHLLIQFIFLIYHLPLEKNYRNQISMPDDVPVRVPVEHGMLTIALMDKYCRPNFAAAERPESFPRLR